MTNWITNTLVATVAVAGSVTDAGSVVSTERALRRQIEAFKNAGDTRDSASIENILHASFRLNAFVGEASEGMLLDKAAYLGAMKAGKLGGSERSHEVITVDIRRNTAACRVRMQSKDMRFDSYMHWVLLDGQWRLLNDVTNAVAIK
jgi:hypothetical protein